MIDITPYSVLSVMLFTSAFIFMLIIITGRNSVISRVPIWLIILVIIMLCLRMLLPIEFISVSKALDSFTVLPNLNEVANYNISNDINFTIANLLCLVWIIGAIFFLTRYFITYYLFARRFKFILTTSDDKIISIVEKIKIQYNFKFDVGVISNNIIESPAEFGLFNKVILIDKNRYSDEELYYILFHEMVHFHNGTNWIKLIMNVIVSVFWWNPIMYLLRYHINNLLEIYVDKFISRNYKATLEYLQCIASVVKKSGEAKLNSSFVKSMAADFIIKRAKIITSNNKNNIFVCCLVVIIMMFYLVISSIYVIQPAYDTSAEQLTIPEFNEDNSYIVKENNVYRLYYKGAPFISDTDINVMPKNIKIIDRGD